MFSAIPTNAADSSLAIIKFNLHPALLLFVTFAKLLLLLCVRYYDTFDLSRRSVLRVQSTRVRRFNDNFLLFFFVRFFLFSRTRRTDNNKIIERIIYLTTLCTTPCTTHTHACTLGIQVFTLFVFIYCKRVRHLHIMYARRRARGKVNHLLTRVPPPSLHTNTRAAAAAAALEKWKKLLASSNEETEEVGRLGRRDTIGVFTLNSRKL